MDEKKEWDTIAQSFYECCNSALLGLKRAGYLTLDDYESITCEIQKKFREPED